MNGQSVLIAAFSGRALARSARAAGYTPLVVDCFGDLDMQEAAEAWRCLPARVQVGFRRKPLVAALDELAGSSSSAPMGLVLGTGFECDPRMMERLAEHFLILGNTPDTVRQTKDPDIFFGALANHGIRHPETQRQPPKESNGWLMKRIGGSGGLHIHRCPSHPKPDTRRYFQSEIEGDTLSALGIVDKQGAVFAFTRQWCAPLKKRPYRYGGVSGPVTPEPDLEAHLIDICLSVSTMFALQGLVSFDFLFHAGELFLIEVNPRPGASLDVLDDEHGSLFHAHILACTGGDAADALVAGWQPPKARAAAYLYADRGPLKIGHVDWPQWTADRPIPGSRIATRQPVATVIADANTAPEAEHLCRERLGQLQNMLYEGQKVEETKQ